MDGAYLHPKDQRREQKFYYPVHRPTHNRIATERGEILCQTLSLIRSHSLEVSTADLHSKLDTLVTFKSFNFVLISSLLSILFSIEAGVQNYQLP